jgi:hypothetical protein
MLNDDDMKDLTKAITYWLEYQVLCKREMLVSEGYLKQSIFEFLQNNQPSSEVKVECSHPNLKKVTKGRPRSIDFGLFSRDKKYLEAAIELKWIGNNTSSVDEQDLLDDILRLECIRGEKSSMPRYFVLVGKPKNVDKLFSKKINFEQERFSFIDEILPNDKERTNIEIKKCEEAFRLFYFRFHKSYKIDLPLTFNIKLVEDKTGDHIKVRIWKIESSSNRQTFVVTDVWENIDKMEKEIAKEEKAESVLQ